MIVIIRTGLTNFYKIVGSHISFVSCPAGFSGDRCELLDGQSDAWSYDVEEMDRENETMTLDQMSSSFETIAKTCIPITCFVLIAIVAIVKLRLFTIIFESLRRDKDDNAAVVQNLENCYKMCERVTFAFWRF